ncbi:hypothetical protein GCM10022393_27670 [Aquimarina addita]|uniref:Rho termination factor N-terminal domain-containing protein n=1 Tax=Aquimarina addita TaxID=870485 RepID=A0ABP6UR58_9FLAO
MKELNQGELIRIADDLKLNYGSKKELIDDLDDLMYLLNHIDRDYFTQKQQQNIAFFLKSFKKIAES